MSFTWRSILAGREYLNKGLRFQVGDGSSISLWDDPWLPLPYHALQTFFSPNDDDKKDWLQPLINELYTSVEACHILSIPLSLRSVTDRLVWHYDKESIIQC